MKKLLLILFLVLFSTPSFGEWKMVTKGEVYGDIYYVDFNKITKQSGFIFWWQLADFEKNTGSDGTLSNVVYYQGNCQKFKAKPLIYLKHKLPMGKGKGQEFKLPSNYDKWLDASTGTSLLVIMTEVCKRAN